MHQICSKKTTRCWKLCFTSFCVKNFLLSNYKCILLENAVCMKSPPRIQLAVVNCSTSFCVKNFLFSNYKDIFRKNLFCIKSAQRIQLAFEICVALHFVLKRSVCEIIMISWKKMRFASNLLKEYNSLFIIVFQFIFC